MKKIMAIVLTALFMCTGLFAAKLDNSDNSDFTTLKEKISLGFDVTQNEVSLRLWPNNSIGMQVSTGLNVDGKSYTFNLGGGMVMPMKETGNFAINLIPGLKFGYYNSGDDNGYSTSSLSFLGGAELDFEMLLTGISKDLSIASGVGAWIGIRSNTVTINSNSSSTSDFMFDLAKEVGFKAVEFRYYF
jgi:hypothetical protein